MSDDPHYQELQKVIADIRHWAKDNLTKKHRERVAAVERNLMFLDIALHQHPEQAKAALYTANAVWHMLFEDARRGARQRGLHLKALPHLKATKEELEQAIDDYCKKYPDGLITHARVQVAKDYKYNDPKKNGAKYVATKTERYNPYKII